MVWRVLYEGKFIEIEIEIEKSNFNCKDNSEEKLQFIRKDS